MTQTQTQSDTKLCDCLVQFLIVCDISSIVPKINKKKSLWQCCEILRTFQVQKISKNIRPSSYNFCLTMSCYWAVSNFLEPWVKVKVKVNVMSLQLLGCRGIIGIICTLLCSRGKVVSHMQDSFYKPIPNSLIFQTLTSFHRSQPPNDPQFCALPFLKA